MKYQMINEELQIASCSIADLTMEQVQSFLKQWEPGSSIGNLTLFYDRNNHVLVLNRDNADYDLHKNLSEEYLSASKEERKYISEKAPRGLKETIEVLDNCIKARTVGREIDIAMENHLPDVQYYVILREIWKKFDFVELAVPVAFKYGVMVGKRIERARRKAGASNVSV